MPTKQKRDIKKLTYNSIRLLNPVSNDGGAFVRIRLNGNLNKKGNWRDGQIEIRDCNNSALLHGEFGSPEGKGKFLHKINVLIEELEKAKAVIIDATKEHNLKIKEPI